MAMKGDLLPLADRAYPAFDRHPGDCSTASNALMRGGPAAM
jgi:hypothetical protein